MASGAMAPPGASAGGTGPLFLAPDLAAVLASESLWVDAGGMLALMVCGGVVNAVFRQFVGHEVLDGSPRWSWRRNLVYSLGWYPLLCLIAMAARDWDTRWLDCGWPGYNARDGLPARAGLGTVCGPMWRERLFAWVFWAQTACDMPPFVALDDPVMWVHHIAVLGTVAALLTTGGGGIGSFVLGTMLMELGSMTFGRFVIHKHDGRGVVRSREVVLLYCVGMSVSNAVPAGLLYRMLTSPHPATFVKCLFGIALSIFFIIRQKIMMEAVLPYRGGLRRGSDVAKLLQQRAAAAAAVNGPPKSGTPTGTPTGVLPSAVNGHG